MGDHHLIGIEIGGTKLQLVRAGASLSIEEELCLDVEKAAGAKGIRRQIENALLRLTAGHKISAVGMGFGGPVNYMTGKVSVSHQIDGWEGFDLRHWLEELSQAPAFIDNDANVAALGEAVHGAGQPYVTVFYMTIGSGIGGGVVQRGKIYHGAVPGEVEIGHVRLNKQGQTLESLCCGWAVDQKVRELAMAQPDSLLARLTGGAGKGEAQFLRTALQGNDPAARDILLSTADNIAFALSHIVHLFHPDVIIVGGGLSSLGGYLTDEISAALPRYLMTSFLPPPPVRIAALGRHAVPVGALELARNALLTHDQETGKINSSV